MGRITHWGGILKGNYLGLLSLPISVISKDFGIYRKTISKIFNVKGAITPNMALCLSKAFNSSLEFWLNTQMNYVSVLRNKNLPTCDLLEKE